MIPASAKKHGHPDRFEPSRISREVSNNLNRGSEIFLAFVYYFVHARNVKTITLDEAAYERLKAWKRGRNESFSSVVKRIIPEPGSLGAFLTFSEAHQTQSLVGNEIMEQAVEERSSAKEDPWT
jgi:predicted CopG family antitoxin